MNIAIDLDGVLFDTESAFKAYSQIFDLKNGKYGMSSPEELKAQNRYSWPKELLHRFLAEKLLDILQESPVMPYAKQILTAAAKHNKIYVITSRGCLSEREIEITKKRLEEENIPFEKIIFYAKDKLKVCQDLKIDLMIDDLYENIVQVASGNIKCFYYRDLVQKFIHNDYVTEVNNWGDIAVEFEKLGIISADDLDI